MKKLGYIRTSTDKQLIARQVQQLEKICERVYIESGVSAVKKRRPVYEEMLGELKHGDVFVVLSLDRAYRSVLDALSELDKLHQRGIAFYSVTQNFDTRTPEGKLLYTVSAALAEWERSILSKRTKEGLAAARKNGSQLGRPRKLSNSQVEWARKRLGRKTDFASIRQLSNIFEVSQRTLVRAIQSVELKKREANYG